MPSSGGDLFPSIIGTERLRLVPAREEYAPAIFEAYACDEQVTRFLSWSAHRTLSDTRRFLRSCELAWSEGIRYPYAILPEENPNPIGMIDVTPHDFRVETGYVLARAHWGKGYMTEALRAVIEACFQNPGIYRFEACCHVQNQASWRVMEKAGMKYEGVLRRFHRMQAFPEPVDVRIYSMVREDLPLNSL